MVYEWSKTISLAYLFMMSGSWKLGDVALVNIGNAKHKLKHKEQAQAES